MLDQNEIVELKDTSIIEDEDQNGDFDFISSGSELKDKILKGIISDSPNLFQDASKNKKWTDIVKSANPGGEAEKFAISQFIKEESKVLPTLLAVKKLMIRNRDGLTVLKAYSSYKLKDFIDRIDLNKIKVVTHTKVEMIDDDNYKTEKTQEIEMITDEMRNESLNTKHVIDTIKPILKVGDVITNPNDSSQTYTIGQRGRRPKFISEYLSDKIISEKVESNVSNQSQLKFGDVITNPNDPSQIYTIGKMGRGRPAKWVSEYLKDKTIIK